MIKTLLFDFGDVFLNLDKPATLRQLKSFGHTDFFTKEQITLLETYEKGQISTPGFVENLKRFCPGIPEIQLLDAWNSVLLDFPQNRFDFIQKLSEENKYQLILLSNTNELHIDWVSKNIAFFEAFKNCFDAFYLSHEINFRKPNYSIFEFILRKHQLCPQEILFIDDTKENTDAAEKLGFHTWNIHPEIEDVTDLFIQNKSLF